MISFIARTPPSMRMSWLALSSLLGMINVIAAPSTVTLNARSAYTVDGTCDGLPRLKYLQTPAGICVGIVATGLRFPRGVAQLDNGDLVLADMGGWAKDRGSVWLLRRAADGSYAKARVNAGIDKPSGIAVGPDQLVYVGTPDAIYRFDPYAATLLTDPSVTLPKSGAFAGAEAYKQPRIRQVIKGLPSDGRHPLKKFVFDRRDPWTLYVNLGSISDVCEQAENAIPPAGFPSPCAESEGRAARGAIRRYRLTGAEHLADDYETIAHGLRNSMALVVHPASNVLLQAENSRDAIAKLDASLKQQEGELPHEELNVIADGDHYGWPYCYDNGSASPEYRGRIDCSKYTKPTLLLPAHAAPLGMTYYNGSLLPADYRGQLIVAYHGYREHGHRLVLVPVDARGVPGSGQPRDIVRGWDKRSDSRDPQGAPVDVLAALDGSLYVTEDKNGTLLRVFYDQRAGDGAPMAALASTTATADPDEANRCADLSARSDAFSNIQRDVIDPQCSGCHGVGPGFAGNLALLRCDAIGNAKRLTAARGDGRAAYVVSGDVRSELLLRLHGDGVPRMPAGGLSAQEIGAVEAWVLAGAALPGNP